MAFLSDRHRQAIAARFAKELIHEVRLVFFTRGRLLLPGEEPCVHCDDTEALLREVAATSSLLVLSVHNLRAEPELAREYGVSDVPGLAVAGDRDHGIRFFGIPAGYEFSSLIEAIIDVSRRRGRLQPATVAALATLSQPVHLRVFVTPTCPHCPQAVRVAHQMALESDLVRADAVEAMEFPELAGRFAVSGVPKVVINDRHEFVGALPEPAYVEAVLAATREEDAYGNDDGS